MKKIASLLLIAMLLFAACQQTNSNENELLEEVSSTEDTNQLVIESQQISSAHLKLVPSLFKAKLENSPGIILLDIRTPEELAENGSIVGAKNLDFYDNDFENKLKDMDLEAPVMLYCRSGGRSGEAAAMMKELGFKQVYDLNGGYNAWLAEYPKK